jgi:hypothetical protein
MSRLSRMVNRRSSKSVTTPSFGPPSKRHSCSLSSICSSVRRANRSGRQQGETVHDGCVYCLVLCVGVRLHTCECRWGAGGQAPTGRTSSTGSHAQSPTKAS